MVSTGPGFEWLIQDKLDPRRSRLLDRGYALSGLAEGKDLKDFDWTYNLRLSKREILELGTLKFIDAKHDTLLISPPGTGKSHVGTAPALLAVQRGDKVLYREAHQLIKDINEARALRQLRKYRAQLKVTELLHIDDLFLCQLPTHADNKLADVLISRHEKVRPSSLPIARSTIGSDCSATWSSSRHYSTGSCIAACSPSSAAKAIV